MRNVCTTILAGVIACGMLLTAQSTWGGAFRPPAAPLITIDPYTSCWSMSDLLTGDSPRHWTGKTHAMSGFIRVDGRPLRFMGASPTVPEILTQTSLEVRATQTLYTFGGAGIELKLTFTSPLLMDNLDVLSRPASYVTFAVRATDGRKHATQLYFDASAEWAVNEPRQAEEAAKKPRQIIQWKRLEAPGLSVMAVGTKDQKILGTWGDDVRIDWGHLLVAVPSTDSRTVIATDEAAQCGFAQAGLIPSSDDTATPGAISDHGPVLAASFDLGQVGGKPVTRHLIVAYDDIYSIQYNHKPLRAWWRRNADATPEKMLAAAEKDYPALMKRCAKFDKRLAADARKAGGEEYATLCALVYRQAIAAHKLVAAADGTKYFFSKECFSNGSCGTVDLTYPSAPLFLIYNPELLKGMLDPVFEQCESGRWKQPYAPHDSGVYPIADGNSYGGPEHPMPVEESGNMIILTGAIAKVEGKADFAKKHWATLTGWAEYLRKEGFDPGNQLCTDDFAGHLAHNANLSIKAIIALGCYGQMAGMLGDKATRDEYLKLAHELAGKWAKAAAEGDHFRLAFDQPGTWSQKYNLVWDKVLGLNLFDPAVARKEIAFYLTRQNKYGLPLDSRKTYTKSDWIMWSAAMAESPEDFRRLLDPVYRYLNDSPSRVPTSDFHETLDGKVVGFQARSVVGGFYMKMLRDKLK